MKSKIFFIFILIFNTAFAQTNNFNGDVNAKNINTGNGSIINVTNYQKQQKKCEFELGKDFDSCNQEIQIIKKQPQIIYTHAEINTNQKEIEEYIYQNKTKIINSNITSKEIENVEGDLLIKIKKDIVLLKNNKIIGKKIKKTEYYSFKNINFTTINCNDLKSDVIKELEIQNNIQEKSYLYFLNQIQPVKIVNDNLEYYQIGDIIFIKIKDDYFKINLKLKDKELCLNQLINVNNSNYIDFKPYGDMVVKKNNKRNIESFTFSSCSLYFENKKINCNFEVYRNFMSFSDEEMFIKQLEEICSNFDKGIKHTKTIIYYGNNQYTYWDNNQVYNIKKIGSNYIINGLSNACGITIKVPETQL